MTAFNERRSLVVIALIVAALFFAVFLVVTSGVLGQFFDPEGETRDDAGAAAVVSAVRGLPPLP